MTEEFRAQMGTVLRGKVLFDEPMALHTSLRTGGPADCFAIPSDVDDLRNLTMFLADKGIPYLVVGGGFNLLVRDGGLRGVTISLGQLTGLRCADIDLIEAEAGVDNGVLARFALENALGGLEFLVGIPGKLGGTLAMNAGAGGRAITDRLVTLRTLLNGIVTVRKKEDIEFGYRFLNLAQGEIIVSALFRLNRESRAVIEEQTEAFLEHRRKTQQVGFPNAGSFFKNPPGQQAWRLIDEAGLRGYGVGGAQVSEVHTNFLVNRGGAKAADFMALAGHIKRVISEKTGIVLEEEVKIVGEG